MSQILNSNFLLNDTFLKNVQTVTERFGRIHYSTLLDVQHGFKNCWIRWKYLLSNFMPQTLHWKFVNTFSLLHSMLWHESFSVPHSLCNFFFAITHALAAFDRMQSGQIMKSWLRRKSTGLHVLLILFSKFELSPVGKFTLLIAWHFCWIQLWVM